jgi:hypothetical protein
MQTKTRDGRMIRSGGCHCGGVRLSVESAVEAADMICRLCTCSFCRRHAPRYWSDPAGKVTLEDPQGKLRNYRFGTHTADFLLCAECGCLLGAACRIDDRDFAVVNVNCIDELTAQPLTTRAVDFSAEDVTTRLARRRTNWMPLDRGASL